jgi:hypothetical protein
VTDPDRDALEQKIAALGQSVATVVADLRLELLAIRGVLIDQKLIESDAVTKKAAALRDSQIPRLTAEASGDMLRRFEKLCEQLGIR